MKKFKTNILKQLMDKYEYSVADMCQKLDISQTVFKNLMEGKTEPSLQMRKQIRVILDYNDAFPNLDDSFEGCKKCVHKCKQLFFVSEVMCRKYKPQ